MQASVSGPTDHKNTAYIAESAWSEAHIKVVLFLSPGVIRLA